MMREMVEAAAIFALILIAVVLLALAAFMVALAIGSHHTHR
jgi:hypothetical protein